MRFLRGFGSFWYQLIIGDDWRIAVGVAIALTIGALLAASNVISGGTLAVLIAVLIFGGFVVNVIAAATRGDS